MLFYVHIHVLLVRDACRVLLVRDAYIVSCCVTTHLKGTEKKFLISKK